MWIKSTLLKVNIFYGPEVLTLSGFHCIANRVFQNNCQSVGIIMDNIIIITIKELLLEFDWQKLYWYHNTVYVFVSI